MKSAFGTVNPIIKVENKISVTNFEAPLFIVVGVGEFHDLQHQPAHPLPSDDQLRALEDEKETIRREYEAKLAHLQAQFSKEQCDKAVLQEEFAKLQQARDAQLAEAQVNNTHAELLDCNDRDGHYESE